MKNLKFKIIIFILFFSFIKSQNSLSDSFLPEIKAKINIDTLYHFVKILSGEIPSNIYVNGQPYTIKSRNCIHPESGIEIAHEYLQKKLESYGYSANIQTEWLYSNYGYVKSDNVIGTKIGSKYPDKYYIICAHYDSWPRSSISPGADDNASGTAAVLEAARILKDYKTDYSVIFALWDAEEIGLIGSKYYAQEAKKINMDIKGVINLDMIAYDSNNDMKAELHKYGNVLANEFFRLNNQLSINLNIVSIDPATPNSDHQSFKNHDYNSVLLIEDYASDFNKYYHTSGDLISLFNQTYFHKMSQLSITTLSSFAQINQFTSIDNIEKPFTYQLKQNYPNPFNPSTIIEFNLAEASFVKLSVYSITGQVVKELVNDYKPSGNYKIDFNATDLPSGVYLYRLITDKFTETKKMLILK